MLVFPLPVPPGMRPLPPASSTALLPCALARPPLLHLSPWWPVGLSVPDPIDAGICKQAGGLSPELCS